jgi:predicted deacetylase
MKILLDFDDLYSEHPYDCLDSIDYLVKAIPNIKILLFTIPNLGNRYISNKNSFIDKVKKYINSDNIKIGIHGNTHDVLEFKYLNYNEAISKLLDSHRILDNLQIDYERIFKGPHWGINSEVINALNALEYKCIFNHEDYMYLETTDIKYIYYNWNLKDDFDESLLQSKFIIAHGHTHNVCNNGIFEVRDKIIDTIKKYNLEPSYDILYNTYI